MTDFSSETDVETDEAIKEDSNAQLDQFFLSLGFLKRLVKKRGQDEELKTYVTYVFNNSEQQEITRMKVNDLMKLLSISRKKNSEDFISNVASR